MHRKVRNPNAFRLFIMPSNYLGTKIQKNTKTTKQSRRKMPQNLEVTNNLFTFAASKLNLNIKWYEQH
jgi:hypothetical protein